MDHRIDAKRVKKLADYHLETENGEKLESGTQVIKRLGLSYRSILFPSVTGDKAIVEEAKDVGVQVLTKE